MSIRLAIVIAVTFLMASTNVLLSQEAKKPPLKWGMDASGGAPYVFDENRQGFEIELAAYIANKLGRTSEPVNFNDAWDNLPDLLQKGEIDLVLNGYEYADQFKENAGRPYYFYKLAVVVRANDASIRNWDDLRARSGDSIRKKIGVLGGSAAARYLEKEFGDSIELLSFKRVSDTFDLVKQQRLDATVQDNPAASYYLAEDARGAKLLRGLNETRAEGCYVPLTREADAEFRKQIDGAIRDAIEDGTMEAIYRKYGIWNTDQERLGYWSQRTQWPEPIEGESAAAPPMNWNVAIRLLLYAAAMTIFLAVASMPLATFAGLVVATMRMYGPRWFGWLLTGYVEVLRGTPLLLQLWVLFYLLPTILPVLSQMPKELIGVLGLALNYSASLAEHFRGAYRTLPAGQREAAVALGFTTGTMIRRILMPQAVRAAIPSVTNDFVALFKDTAVCSVIAVVELTQQYNSLYNNYRDHVFAFAAITAALYLTMSYPLSIVARWLESRR